jgi:hypothetical protein
LGIFFNYIGNGLTWHTKDIGNAIEDPLMELGNREEEPAPLARSRILLATV